ncbi:hypothetical protein PG993_003775 [Apiospora rasikravindrae]|uniref:C6 zinc finger domain-containing protein n=1 Tax=Apiospora rasikravindrae TaxID=990691 RepID=A0ABR1U0G8_9PEZI
MLSIPLRRTPSNPSSSPGKTAKVAPPGSGMTVSEAVPAKSRRVRTGKSNRECKRGVRLNFIDLTCKEPPILLPPTEEWSVQFQDESRQIASEYRGGLGRYAKLEQQVITPPHEPDRVPDLRRQSFNIARLEQHHAPPIDRRYSTTNLSSLQQSTHYREKAHSQSDAYSDGYQTRRNSDASFLAFPNPSTNRGYESLLLTDPFAAGKEETHRSQSRHTYRGSDVSTAASIAGMTVGNPPPSFRGGLCPGQDPIGPPDTGMMTPTSDKAGEREYLNSPEELHFMQVFVEEVGVWMDSLDEKKHFSRLVPYHALKCPMLLNALLACGVKQLTVTQQFNDDKALFYYDTATTQLLRSLQNPERNTAECATTAVVLNVYEIMSEKPTQRMSHIAGARALIRECGWNAKSTGLGAACFWLNVGMELLSCLAFNWQTAWEPDQWGVDMDFFFDSTNPDKQQRDSSISKGEGIGHGAEETWVHRMFFIVAKICNFRASIPNFKNPSPHDEQMRLQERYAEWQRLKGMCDTWNDACPRPMHPFGYLYPSQSRGGSGGRPTSLFPNVWLIKRAAIVGRLFYHTAQCLLAQINPILPKDSDEARAVQQHHAHQVCGIVAHTRDRGVASVSIRSLAIVAEVLTDRAEQRECVDILENIDKATGWKLGAVVKNLKRVWGWEKQNSISGLAAQFLPAPNPTNSNSNNNNGNNPSSTTTTAPSSHTISTAPSPSDRSAAANNHNLPTPVADRANSISGSSAGQMIPGLAHAQANGPAHAQGQPPPVAAPRPVRLSVNPLSFADFSLPNHPYQNWYEPPSRSSSYKSSQGLL